MNGEDTADSFFDLILEAPANYLKYYVGYLCFEDLKRAAMEKEGSAFSLKTFHKKYWKRVPVHFQYYIKKCFTTDTVQKTESDYSMPVSEPFLPAHSYSEWLPLSFFYEKGDDAHMHADPSL